MKENIRKLINDYSLNNKYVDEYFFNILFNEFMNLYKLNNTVKDFNINNDNNNFAEATYNIDKKIITINYFLLEDYIKDGKVNNYSNNNLYYFVNMKFLLAIMHELEHAKQLELLSTSKNDLTNLLIKYGYSFTVLEFRNSIYTKLCNYQVNNLYEKTYNYNPIERMANINSLFQLLSIFNKEYNLSDRVFNYFMNEMYKIIPNGYSKNIFNNIISPTEVFFKMINNQNIWKNLDFYNFNRHKMLELVTNKHTLEERLTLGLPLSYDEIKNYSYKKIKRRVKS